MGTKISGTTGVTFPDNSNMFTGQQACKAWVNFNGTGTVAIRQSFNVSSITDNGAGNYTVNFTNAMVDANYAVHVTKGSLNNAVNAGEYYLQILNTTNQTTVITYENSALVDCSSVTAIVFR